MKPSINEDKRDRLYELHRSIEELVDMLQGKLAELDLNTEEYEAFESIFKDIHFKLYDFYEELRFS